MQEAKEPLDYEAFVRLMSRRTQELDPEDVLLEAWSKWDDHGTGKIDERKWVLPGRVDYHSDSLHFEHSPESMKS